MANRCGIHQNWREQFAHDLYKRRQSLPNEDSPQFPVSDKNCYNRPFISQKKYLVSTGFDYGNYDNLLKVTVENSLGDEPHF
ncbi:Malectin-like carbohydrate-binding domain containing protein [Trema orientale]|uniref:Malectin-like carbohydrate-binding domain containing protein n=1 Tax=Trema orientale TaxID=63057 RepID=A0A2P5ATI9_TREOI|nr:Malectin-like carbohydrate-binding domain containing protein [Trema orientale]